MSKKEKKSPKPKVHKDLQGFEMSIDTFGEIKSNMNIEKINEFLNKNVSDKKLTDRDEPEEPTLPSGKAGKAKKKKK
ncbi:MAG: hypothetical protein L0Y35_07965 [Flammeovirgaceae bacterium]|nr:hypothetical protein [Flammeovirgaceae bacterium]